MNSEADFSRLTSLIRSCTMCNIPPPAYPIISGSYGARVMTVGQCPGMIECEKGIPFAGQAGRRLFSWLESVDIQEKNFRAGTYMTAITKCLPAPDKNGRREKPLPREVINCAPYLVSELRLIEPKLLIPIGMMSIQRFLGNVAMTDAVGKVFVRRYHSFDTVVIPLPHPSGRSAWVNLPGNRARLNRALHELGRRFLRLQATAP